MNKKKLDLNSLLAKYQGISQTHGAFYSPPQQYSTINLNTNNRGADATVQADFYQSRHINPNKLSGEVVTYSQPVTGNFQMSKSECEQFLLRVRQELRNEERGLQGFAENAYKHIHEKFQANHEKIKQQILQLLDRSFKQNERFITEELRRQGSSEPSQFIPIHKRIAGIDEDINRLLYGLKGADYRKSIAETVLKDFSVQISGLRENVKVAKDEYLSGLGEVEPDRERIQCIRSDLQRLFRISRKQGKIISQGIFGVLGALTRQPEQQSTQNPRFTQYQPAESQVNPDPQQRQRKSFFNFQRA